MNQSLPVNFASLLSLAAWRDPLLPQTVLRRPLWAQRWRSLLLTSSAVRLPPPFLSLCRFCVLNKVWTSEEPVPTCMTIPSTRPLLPFLWKRAGAQRRRRKPPLEDQSRVRNIRNKNRCKKKKSGVGFEPERVFFIDLRIINVLFSCKFLVLFRRTQHLPAVQQDRVFRWADPSLSVGFLSQDDTTVRLWKKQKWLCVCVYSGESVVSGEELAPSVSALWTLQ